MTRSVSRAADTWLSAFAHLIGGLLTVEQCLPGIDADRTRRGDALDGVGKTVGQEGGTAGTPV
jgi:hypothetical protein